VVKVSVNGEKMKRKFLPAVSLLVVMALAACGPKSVPGLGLTDVQNTAVALAGTAIAITQSALPTNTSVPTNTSIPPTPTTDAATLAILPTSALQAPIVAPITGSNASPTPDCYQPAPPTKKLLGTTVQIKLVNKSDGPVNLSLGMYKPNDQGECFTFSFGVNKNGSQVVTILSGCYWGAGYQNGPKPSTPRVDYICLTDTTETRGLTIDNNAIGFD
jgi:predicted small secreted protein